MGKKAGRNREREKVRRTDKAVPEQNQMDAIRMLQQIYNDIPKPEGMRKPCVDKNGVRIG